MNPILFFVIASDKRAVFAIQNEKYLSCYPDKDAKVHVSTVVPTKSDGDEIVCLQLLSKTLT